MKDLNINMGITPLLYQASHKCMLLQNEILKKFNISVMQAAILGIIRFVEDGSVNQKTLSKEMGVKESSVSSMINTMIKNGLIVREQSKTDARNKILRLGERGREITEFVQNSAKDIENKLYGHLTEEEKSSLVSILKKLI